jgi:hypothetical protein
MNKVRTILLTSILGFTALAGSVIAKAHSMPNAVRAEAADENVKEFNYTIDNEHQLFTSDKKAQDVTVSGWRITCSEAQYDKGTYPYRVRIFVNASLDFESAHTDGKRTIKEVKVYYQKTGYIYQNYMEAVNGKLDSSDFPTNCETWWPSPETDTTVTKAQLKVIGTWNGGTNYLFINQIKISYYENTMTVSASDYEGHYDGEVHAPTITVTDPADGYKIEYSADNGQNYSEEIPEVTKQVGEHSIKYRVVKDSYKNFVGTAKVTILENDKTALQAKIDEAEGLYNQLLAQDPAAAEAFQEAINTANIVKDNPNVTVEEIEKAITDLNIKIEEANEIIKNPGSKEGSKGKLPGWGIALIAVGGVIGLGLICFLVMFFALNKWIKVGEKAIRVVRLGSKDGKVKVLTSSFKVELRDEKEIFKSKKDALK